MSKQKACISLILLALLVMSAYVYAPSLHAQVCEQGSNLSYEQTLRERSNGRVSMQFNENLPADRVTATIINNSDCTLPVSFSTYKMFAPYSSGTLSQQEFYFGTEVVNIAPHQTNSLTANLPTCAAQYDLWYGVAPQHLVDNQVYGQFLAGNHTRETERCLGTPGGYPTLEATCTGTPSYAAVNQSVRWSVFATGGNGYYQYQWQGSDALYGSGQSIDRSYSSGGSKYATVTITSDGEQLTRSCYVTVDAGVNPGTSTLYCYPQNTTVTVGSPATFSASGGNGYYQWYVNDQNYNTSGAYNGTYNNYYNNGNAYTNSQSVTFTPSYAGSYSVRVVSGGNSAYCTVNAQNTSYNPPYEPPPYNPPYYPPLPPNTGAGGEARNAILIVGTSFALLLSLIFFFLRMRLPRQPRIR